MIQLYLFMLYIYLTIILLDTIYNKKTLVYIIDKNGIIHENKKVLC
jgi:hypothetical protein